MTYSPTRRRALQGLGAALVSAPWIARAQRPGSKLRHAAIGLGSQGSGDLGIIAAHPDVEVVAICDVDGNALKATQAEYPKARAYADWRELLKAEAGKIDSVNVSTPDHSHAIITAAAMTQDLHCYTQKPLARTVEEARLLQQMAAAKPHLQTQMGTQIASDLSNIRVVELFETGELGRAKEVYLWSYKTWGDPDDLPNRHDPVPRELDWDGWLAVAAERPYIAEAYHPAEWRKRLDFGTGTLGDMGAHIFHPALAALQLAAPVEITSTGPKPNASNWAINEELHYLFEGNSRIVGDQLALHWYDGDTLPYEEIKQQTGIEKLPSQGGLIICENGCLVCPHTGLPTMEPKERFTTRHPRKNPTNHYHEWVNACLGRQHILRSPFSWGSLVTETILLGGAASFFPDTKLRYNSQQMIFDHPEANQHLRRDYRKGWEIPQLAQMRR